MKRIVFTIIACCLIYTQVFAGTNPYILGSGIVPGGGSCATQSDGFGDSAAASGYLEGAAGTIFVSKFTKSSEADVYSLKFTPYAAGTGSFLAKALIYSHDAVNDRPQALIAEGQGATVTLGSLVEIEDIFASTISLASGTYWIGYTHNHTSNIRFYQTANTTTDITHRDRDGTYASPTDPIDDTPDGTYPNYIRVYAMECN